MQSCFKEVAICGFGCHGIVTPMPRFAPMPRKPKPPTCEQCYFRQNLLCALQEEEPCATFRPNRPEGLVPPRQPVLLMRPPRWAAQTQPA